MTDAMGDILAYAKLMSGFTEDATDIQGGFRDLEVIMSRLEGDTQKLNEIGVQVYSKLGCLREFSKFRQEMGQRRVEGQHASRRELHQVNLLQAPLLSDEFNSAAIEVIEGRMRLSQEIQNELTTRLSDWLSSLAAVEDIDSLDFENPRFSRLLALLNLVDVFQRCFLEAFKQPRLQRLREPAWGGHPSMCLVTREYRLLMDILIHVQNRLKEEIMALRHIFYSANRDSLSPIYREYLETLLEGNRGEIESAVSQIKSHQGLTFAVFGVSYFRSSLIQTIAPESSAVLDESFTRLKLLLTSKLDAIVDQFCKNLEGVVYNLPVGYVSLPDHEAVENIRCLLATIQEAYKSSAPFDDLEEIYVELLTLVSARISETIVTLAHHLTEGQTLVFQLNAFVKLKESIPAEALGKIFRIDELLQNICNLDLNEYLAWAKAPTSLAEIVTRPSTQGLPLESDTIDQLLWQLYRSIDTKTGWQFDHFSGKIENLHLKRQAQELTRTRVTQLYEALSEASGKTSPSHGPTPPGLDQFRMLLYD